MPVKWIKWQKPIQRVLYGLVPTVIASVYFYGWRVLVMLLLVNIAGYLAEYAFTRKWGTPVTSAVLATSTLFCLSLPPSLPLWMAIVGIVFAVVFGKMVFGGLGKNIFNPALTGRAFLYASFGGFMTGRWSEPVSGPWGGIAAFTTDAITQATPGILLKTDPSQVSLSGLLLGNTAGCIGGTSALLVLAGGIYITWTRAANYRIVISGLLGYLVTQGALWMGGVAGAANPLHAALSGSLLIGVFFYATDPVSASQTNEGRWIYGAFVGAMSSLISLFSAWPAGTMFAILLANMFAPIMDYGIRELKKRRRKPAGT
jgi:Na+-transporting NADH:ubiquinone oxidoreductase subunit B